MSVWNEVWLRDELPCASPREAIFCTPNVLSTNGGFLGIGSHPRQEWT